MSGIFAACLSKCLQWGYQFFIWYNGMIYALPSSDMEHFTNETCMTVINPPKHLPPRIVRWNARNSTWFNNWMLRNTYEIRHHNWYRATFFNATESHFYLRNHRVFAWMKMNFQQKRVGISNWKKSFYLVKHQIHNRQVACWCKYIHTIHSKHGRQYKVI